MSRLAPYRFAGGTTVVTGAASGIGEQLGYALATRGSHLVLLDRDEERLTTVAERIRADHPALAVTATVVDLADRSSIPGTVARILARHPRITLLINNAGVALVGRFDELSEAEFDWLMAINFTAPVTLTRLFLPVLQANPGSHIVNMSSLFGLIAPAGQTAYSASKFALRGFSEALRHELAGQVGVTTVHPGGIDTRIAQTARMAASLPTGHGEAATTNFDAKVLTFPADKAAEHILRGVQRRRGRVLVAASAKVPDLLARLLPTSYFDRLIQMPQRGSEPPAS